MSALLLSWLVTAGSAVVLLRSAYRARRRDVLVARASHELRGPLQAVLLGLSAGTRDLRVLEGEVQRVALALQDLDVARGASRPLGRLGDAVDVAALVRAQVAAWEPVADDRGRSLRHTAAAERVVVRGDGRRLAQALGNLIANALDHGEGEIVVAVLDLPGGDVGIEVRDEGPGLRTPLSLTLVRGRTSRGEHGHGLVVASEVARTHGGRLRRAGGGPSGAGLALELPRIAA